MNVESEIPIIEKEYLRQNLNTYDYSSQQQAA